MALDSSKIRYIWQRMLRQKTIAVDDTKTELRRCLSTAHLTFMGVGCTVGVGIYVLVGVAAKDYAGPGVLLSFLLAAVVTMLNAVCYAEFGSRIPKTGAIYTYVYESVCEIMAFLVGWLTLLGFITSGAIASRAWSGYVDSLFNNAIHNATLDHLGKVTLGAPFSDHLDFLACGYEIIVIVIISLGVHTSATLNSILAGVSMSVLVFVTICGFIFGDYANFANADHGGFLPFGFTGVLAGTSACFFAYQGFDVICMSAEEAKTPKTSIPRAILFELIIVTAVYVGSSCALVFLVPYWQINTRAPLPSAFDHRGLQWAKYVVSVGPALGIGNLNILNLYNISRHTYCMASDGLFFHPFLYVNKKTKVPLYPTLFFGVIISVLALVLDIKDLVSFNVIAILIGFILISAIVILIRCRQPSALSAVSSDEIVEFQQDFNSNGNKSLKRGLFYEVEVQDDLRQSTKRYEIMVKLIDQLGVSRTLALLVVSCCGLGLQISKGFDDLYEGRLVALLSVSTLTSLVVFLTMLLSTKCGRSQHDGFKVPMVPYLPTITILVNALLLFSVSDLPGVVGYLLLFILGLLIYVALVLFSGKRIITGHDITSDEEETSLMTQTDLDEGE